MQITLITNNCQHTFYSQLHKKHKICKNPAKGGPLPRKIELLNAIDNKGGL